VEWTIHMTVDCVRPTQSIVIQTIPCNVGQKCFFFNFGKMFVCYYRYAFIFIHISQGIYTFTVWRDIKQSVNHVIAKCLQSDQGKNFENWSMISEDMDKSEVPRFSLAHPVDDLQLLDTQRQSSTNIIPGNTCSWWKCTKHYITLSQHLAI